MTPTDAASEGRPPSVSIGVPVYNGQAHLEEALDSIAAQTWTDYEVVISDNASADRTQAICEERARRDSRIRYFRNAENIGADRNYDRTFELSSGKYFMTLAHDDRLHPDYLASIVPVMENDPEVVFCHSRAYRIDKTGAMLGTTEPQQFSQSAKLHERFGAAIAARPSTVCLGVVRSSVLRQVPPLCGYPNSDAYRQADLGLRGKLVEIPQILFYKRDYLRSVGNTPIHRRLQWSNPSMAGAIVFPGWRRPKEYALSVLRTPMSLSERVLCFAEIARYVGQRGLQPFLRDLKPAAWGLLSRSRTGLRILEGWSHRRKQG
jgi:glycosyltransferase involved in cell wall biosynthesis